MLSDPAADPDTPGAPRLKPAGLNEWAGDTTAGVHWCVIRGDSRHVLRTFDANRFACVVTSPPYYWQRDYHVDHQIGLETSISGYVTAIADTMEEVRRVLSRQGVLFLNLADTYYSAKGQPKGRDRKNRARRFGLRAVDASGLGVPRKTLIGIPWRVSLAMIDKGWIDHGMPRERRDAGAHAAGGGAGAGHLAHPVRGRGLHAVEQESRR